MLARAKQAVHWRLQQLCDRLAPTDTTTSGPAEVLNNPAEVFAAMARYVHAARSGYLPARSSDGARRCLMDTVGCIFAGASAAEGRALMSSFNITQNTLFHPGAYHSARDHAYLLAALAQVYDVNDGFVAASGRGRAFHPGRVIVPAALAVALRHSASGQALLAAIALGYDLAACTDRPPLQTPPDAFGCAGAAALLRGHSLDETAFLLRIAAFMSPRSGSEDFETNNLTVAQQAASGVFASDLVSQGYPLSDASAQSLRAPQFSFEKPTHLGKSFEWLYVKPYPSCRTTHYSIEAILEIRPEIASRLDQVEVIDVHLQSHSRGPAHCVEAGQYVKRYQFSTAYCVAAALVDGKLGLEQFEPERTSDKMIQTLQAKIRFSFAKRSQLTETFSVITVTMQDGKRHVARCDSPLGGPQRPLSDAQVMQKMLRFGERLRIAPATLAAAFDDIKASTDVREALASIMDTTS